MDERKMLEHYIGIYKRDPSNLTLSGKMKLINMLLKERDKK